MNLNIYLQWEYFSNSDVYFSGYPKSLFSATSSGCDWGILQCSCYHSGWLCSHYTTGWRRRPLRSSANVRLTWVGAVHVFCWNRTGPFHRFSWSSLWSWWTGEKLHNLLCHILSPNGRCADLCLSDQLQVWVLHRTVRYGEATAWTYKRRLSAAGARPAAEPAGAGDEQYQRSSTSCNF